ncbi:Hypothetical protein R9X50_00495600 [Acrodontium crateriforme]|uniref:FAD dependent oxidoreductase domain-containing protein n=1 Tax=Acrodontium crateriforme TaxID=150365 RepID=A0AAQ3RAJ1_9PEZI|nr:Hypothetical protein R9X50_00495600 [Acrodontium crateriforme]
MFTFNHPPSSILIVGSGVFGLSTAKALAENPTLHKTQITLLERFDFPAPDGSSIDSSRIVRPDYADGAYASLMIEAHRHWRGDLGKQGRYTESGLCIVTSEESFDDSAQGARTYMEKALENVKARLGLSCGRREDGGQLESLHDPDDVQRIMGSMGGDCGKRGYVNWTSGWADAEAGVRYVREQVEKTNRINFRTAEVKRLQFGPDRVEGVELSSGEILTADLVVLATGAWTPRLVDLRGVASATGQAVAYIDITPDEQLRLGSNPTLICESNGMFIIQPRNNLLKVARHGYGYANFVTFPHPEKPLESGEQITASLPRTKCNDETLQLPAEGIKACREYLATTNPSLAQRPFKETKICWYTDTPSGNWLIDYHPKYKNLFLATGGSGHGYKFLPVIGSRIVDVIFAHDRDALGGELRHKWQWPEMRSKEDHIWTDDWRGGRKGMVLDEELAKTL